LKTDTLHVQNMHLYFYGIVYNLLGYLYERETEESFFEGYNSTTFLVVLSYSFTGLIVSIIMKYLQQWNLTYEYIVISVVTHVFIKLSITAYTIIYADNMVKIYSVSVSMVLTMVLSIFLFDYAPTTQLFYGIVIITVSVLMYFGVLTPKQETLPTRS
jgi:UDP-sugar transporter A1/2/3